MLLEFELLKKYDITPKGVIHIGMHKAEEYPIYIKNGVKKILFIEANKDLANSFAPDDENCTVVHCAVSDKDGEIVEFNITNNGESSSILKLKDHSLIYPHITTNRVEKVKTATLDKVLKVSNQNIEDYNILNMDIQGAELKAMKGFSNWKNIDSVYTEVNYREMYEGCGLEKEVTEFLKSKGFEKVEECDTGAGWGDALYVRK